MTSAAAPALGAEPADLIPYAVLAPSGHNSQPWLFRIEGETVYILPDLERALPAVDGNHRELFISLGCALENLCLAAGAAGYCTRVGVSDAGVCAVELIPDPAMATDPLFDQIAMRQSNRSVYDGRRVPQQTLERALGVATGPGVQISAWERDSDPFIFLAECIAEGNAVQMGDRAFRHELKAWLRFSGRQSRRSGDGLSHAVMGLPSVPRAVGSMLAGLFLTARSQNRSDRRKVESSSHLVLLSAADEGPRRWIALGRSLERLLLALSAEGVAVAHMNQPCEVGSVAARITETLLPETETPVILLRVGYAAPAARSLRRPVQEVLVTTAP